MNPAPPRPRLFLVDGTALAYRSHFALTRAGLATRSGMPTGATVGFANTLRALVDREKPDRLVVAFDTGEATERHRLLPTYKATREKAPEEMVAQLPWIERLAAAYGSTVVKRDGVEADDLLATLAVRGARQGMEVVLVTGDKDFAQLVGPHVKMMILSKPDAPAQLLDHKGVEEKYGVPPERIPDWLALMGDSSDNVPGIRGVGEKTAAELVRRFGRAEDVLSRASEIERGKLREAVERDAEHVRLAKRLVTLDTEVPDLPDPASLPAQRPDVKSLRELYRELDFNNLLHTLPAETAAEPEAGRKYHCVSTPEAFEAMLSRLSSVKKIAFDTETTGLDALACRAVGISLCGAPLEAYYVPLLVDPPVLPGGAEEIARRLKGLMEDPRVEKIGQNSKFDLLVLGGLGIDVKPVTFDTMVASFCISPTGRAHNLDALALRYLDLKKIPTEALLGSGKNQRTMDLVPVAEVAEYACEDADAVFRLEPLLRRDLEKEGTLDLFETIEMPLVPILTAMERRGVKIDTGRLKDLSKALAQEAARLEREIHELAGTPFSIASTRELGAVLFERLRLHEAVGRRTARRTKTGYSTDADVLEELAAVAPIAAKVLEYRQVTKLQNTYAETLPDLVNPRTGRIHTTFRQAVAATGRLSSDNPNLQNIPIRTALGREIRKAFVPDAGSVLISADYSQIELRLVAHFSDDPVLKEAFYKGEDIHRRTAAVVFGVAPELVTPELRSRAKAINFGIIYGMGPQRLARETGMTVPEARKFIDAYFERLPAVRRFLDGTLAKAEATGVATTLAGRKRPIPELQSQDPRVRANAANIAVNTPIQGSAADVIKRAMIELDRVLGARGLPGGMILQVHDELVLEVPKEHAAEVSEATRRAMEGAVQLSVPLKVDLGIGTNWLEAHG